MFILKVPVALSMYYLPFNMVRILIVQPVLSACLRIMSLCCSNRLHFYV